jgi:hypothetical protein
MLSLNIISLNKRSRRLKTIFYLLAGIFFALHLIMFYFIDENIYFLYPFFLCIAVEFVFYFVLNVYSIIGTVEMDESKMSICQPSQTISIKFNDIAKLIWYRNDIEGEISVRAVFVGRMYDSSGINKLKIITTANEKINILFLVRNQKQMILLKQLIKNIPKVSKRKYSGFQ